MTWGVQNTEEEAHAQMDLAIKEHGVNFIDTAEMYPVPSFAEGWVPGTTEEFIGSWLEKNPECRSKVVLASKVVGFWPNSRVPARRSVPEAADGVVFDCRLDAKSVKEACEASLRRLRTDCIDLYQIHWPDRSVPIFGQLQYKQKNERRDSVPIEETAAALKELLEAGKIRAYGLSNETTFGVCQWAHAAELLGMPPPASIQNSHSLLVRNFEADLAEACAPSNLNIGLLPYSVLCGGLLTGKYGVDKAPPGARFTRFPQFMSRWAPQSSNQKVKVAVEDYERVAKQAGLTMADLAIRWSRTREYIAHGSVIIGGTSCEQLADNLKSFEGPALSEDLQAEVDEIHSKSFNAGCGL